MCKGSQLHLPGVNCPPLCHNTRQFEHLQPKINMKIVIYEIKMLQEYVIIDADQAIYIGDESFKYTSHGLMILEAFINVPYL